MSLTTPAALFATALMVGSMVFFAAGVAPLTFTRLPPGQAGLFIRQILRDYYLYVLETAAPAGVAWLPFRPYDALAMFATVGSTRWAGNV